MVYGIIFVSGRSAAAWPKGASRVFDSLQAPPGFCFIEAADAFLHRDEQMENSAVECLELEMVAVAALRDSVWFAPYSRQELVVPGRQGDGLRICLIVSVSIHRTSMQGRTQQQSKRSRPSVARLNCSVRKPLCRKTTNAP